MATGLGKTVYASHLAKDFLPRGRVMLLAHREELVDQGRNTLERVTGRDVDIERAEFWAQEGNPWAQCEIVASTIQSQNAGAGSKLRMERFDPNDFSLLVVDEAHHATAKSYRQVIDYYRQNPDLCVLGLTATPDRTDEEALGQVFEEVAFEYGILDGINDGWLVPIEQQVVYVQDLDLSHVKSQAGDLNGKDLAAIMEFEANLHGIASPTLEIIGRRKALVFTASVAHAERLCEIFNRHERNVACWVHGGTPKDQRQQIMEAYRIGRHRILCNVGVATEGFDVPDIEVVVMARPTKSRCLYTQMCGRGTRPLAGVVDGIEEARDRQLAIANSAKPTLLVLDFVGNAGKHKLIHAGDILGGRYSDEVIERAREIARREGKPKEVTGTLEEAEREIASERAKMEEQARRQFIKARARYNVVKLNPFEVFEMDLVRENAWQRGKPATEKQIDFLRKHRVEEAVIEKLTLVHASQLIDRLIKRQKQGLCSYRQARILKQRHIDHTSVSFDEARRLIDQIAAREKWGKRKARAS